MVRQIRQKLGGSAGATVVFAIAGLLVAVIASMTMVTAAMNNLHRIDGQQRDQQAYLAVTSAAALLRDELVNDKTVLIVEELNEYGNTVTRAYGVNGSGLPDKDAANLRCGHIVEDGLKTRFVRWLHGIEDTGSGTMAFEAVGSVPAVAADIRLDQMTLDGTPGRITAQMRARFGDGDVTMTMLTLTVPNIRCVKIAEDEKWNEIVNDETGEATMEFDHHVRIYEVTFGEPRVTSGGVTGG